jgi:UPF0716 protein FxsA|tara:strand:- start:1057 stop:1500 length:444 start_codon:yes stop_codon:yes gene_type:complete
MNFLLIIIVAVPLVEIFLLIKIGSFIGGLNTIFLIFLTAVIGVYFAKKESLNTLKSGFNNIYQNKLPIYEIISGASIAVAAVLLIVPGFVTDLMGFILIFPLTRKILIKFWLGKKDSIYDKQDNNTVDAEIVDDVEVIEEKKDKNEL